MSKDKEVSSIKWPRNNPQIYAQQGSFGRGIDIAIFMDSLDGVARAYNVVTLMAKELPEMEVSHSCLTISNEAGKHLMDQLWMCGIRPSKAEDQSAVIRALENHLADTQNRINDLRQLVFTYSVLKGVPKVDGGEE